MLWKFQLKYEWILKSLAKFWADHRPRGMAWKYNTAGNA